MILSYIHIRHHKALKEGDGRGMWKDTLKVMQNFYVRAQDIELSSTLQISPLGA